ncbi:signal peptide protein [Cupriavidus gilardii]|nr:signal peptide protein [Cupriavidus gilardii]
MSNAMSSVGQSAAGIMIANQNSGLGSLVQQAVTVQANLAVGR